MNYEEFQADKAKKSKKKKRAKLRNKILFYLAIGGALYYYIGTPVMNAYYKTSNFVSGVFQVVEFDYSKFSEEQALNIKNVQAAAVNMGHPDVKRMVAHLLTESNAKNVKDGDKGNGFGKKSYGPMQVKLGTVYYNKTLVPELFNKFAPEVNTLAKEDVLHKLRTDTRFNAKMGVITHLAMIKVCKTVDRATVAYNRGKCDADAKGREYFAKILKNEEKL